MGARWRAVAGGLLFGVAAAACGGPGAGTRGDGRPDPAVRAVVAPVLVPPAVNLLDRDVRVVAVIPFEGPSGADLARRLAGQFARAGMFEVLSPAQTEARLTRAGVGASWDPDPTSLRWISERAGIDAVVVGRVTTFHVDDREKEGDTFTLTPTGRFRFERNEKGKLVYREQMVYRRVPLFCRADLGTVAATYRVLDTRRGEVAATLPYRVSTEMSSFCYREDVPEALKLQARNRLLRKLFTQLNDQFLGDVVPRPALRRFWLQGKLGGAPPELVRRNELAVLLASRGEWERAIDLWRDCLDARPDLPGIHYNMAVACRALGRVTLAERHLRKALTRDDRPLYRDALRSLRPPPGG